MYDYPQIERFMREIIWLYGDMTVLENRAKAFPNSGVVDRKLFDDICATYYARTRTTDAPKPEGKKK